MSDDRLDLEKIEHAARVARLLTMLEEGKTDAQAMEELKLKPEPYRQLKRDALKAEASNLRGRTTEEVFAEYVLRQAGCIRDLSLMSRKFDQKKHYSALVASVKARSDIYDKIIKTGQDFGIIERKAERKEIGIAMIVAKLSDGDLRKRVVGELHSIHRFMEEFGEGELLEIEAGALHRPALPAETENRTNRAKANKVHRGRRVVKGND